MYFDRFDIIAAHWMFCMEYHDGMGSKLYQRLSWIGTVFSPSPLWSQPRDLPENAREIYRQLVVSFHGIHSTVRG
jgi:hypothetical protein